MTRNKLSACVLSCVGGGGKETYLYRAVLEVQQIEYSVYWKYSTLHIVSTGSTAHCI